MIIDIIMTSVLANSQALKREHRMKYFTDVKMFMSNKCYDDHDIDDNIVLLILRY